LRTQRAAEITKPGFCVVESNTRPPGGDSKITEKKNPDEGSNAAKDLAAVVIESSARGKNLKHSKPAATRSGPEDKRGKGKEMTLYKGSPHKRLRSEGHSEKGRRGSKKRNEGKKELRSEREKKKW